MKVLVTGGAGFIGRHTVRRLLADGAEVLVLDDFSSSVRACMGEFADEPRFDFVAGDACNELQVREIMARRRPDAVVHLAGLVSVARSLEQPDESWRLNVHATQVVATAAEAAGCQRFVFASSAAVYADSQAFPLRETDPLPAALSPYGAHKAEAEQWLLATANPAMERIALRYFNVYGAGQPADSPYSGVITRFLERLRLQQPLQVFGDGKQSRDFIHIHDLVQANARAAEGALAPGLYNVCTGAGTSINDLVAQVQARLPGIGVENLPPKLGEIRHSLGSTDRLSTALGGWAPTSFAAGLAELLHEADLSNPVGMRKPA